MVTVAMTHPELPGVTIEVAESAVPMLRNSGWITTDGV